MNVVLLHCHYDRGGVTSVVLNQMSSLISDDGVQKILLVSAPRSSGLPEHLPDKVSRFEVSQLDYDLRSFGVDITRQRVSEISQLLTQLFHQEGLTPRDTILHWHNHSLGKNVALPGVVKELATDGWRSMLQIHDFAEDYRPLNYSNLIRAIGANDSSTVDHYLYPVAPQIHYCTLTRSDAEILQQRGVPNSTIGFLPNSVAFDRRDQKEALEEQEEKLTLVRKAFDLPMDSRWCVYPVRGIRRKNVGEFLLLSQLSREDRFSAITLCPTTSVEEKSYRRWKDVAHRYAPRAVFDAGHREGVSFQDNLLASDLILSTSVAEGFGMAFLEPWLLGRPVLARRLKNVIPDFESFGLKLHQFYRSIPIPGNPSWIGICKREWREQFRKSWAGIPASMIPRVSIDEVFSTQVNDSDQIDFALLSPARQIEVLQKISADNGFQAAVRDRAAEVVQALDAPMSHDVIQHNAEMVRSEFGLSSMQERLRHLYSRLLAIAVGWNISRVNRGDTMLDLLMRQRVFYPCRTEEVD